MKIQKELIKKFVIILGIIMMSVSCDEDGGGVKERQLKELQELMSATDNPLFQFNNHLFSIPSPYQITQSIEKSHILFNESIVNDVNNLENYLTTYKQGVNIGIYGADLGYLTLYSQSSMVRQYLNVIETLLTKLRVTQIINLDIIDKLEDNITNSDSLLFIFSDLFESSDVYLKDNEMQDIATLVIIGSWVESLYLITHMVEEEKVTDKEIIKRLGEQKYTIEILLELLLPYYDVAKIFQFLHDELTDLRYIYDTMKSKYTYKDPLTHVNKKLTFINSLSYTRINDEHLDEITDKIYKIRMELIK